jgi:hypothetical protein
MCDNINFTASSIPRVPEQLEEYNPRPRKVQRKSGQDDLSWNFEELFLLDTPYTNNCRTSNSTTDIDMCSCALDSTSCANPGSLISWNGSYLCCDPTEQLPVATHLGCNQAEKIHPPPHPYVSKAKPSFLSRMGLSFEDMPCPNSHRAIYNKAIGPEAYL